MEAYQLSVGSGAPINTPLAFDATVTSFFLPILSGKPITLLPEAGHLEILAEQPSRSTGFSLLKLTPAHVEVLNQLLPREELAGLTHCLVIGGESLNELSVSRWRRHAPQTRLINEYGPTEAVVGCTVYEVQPSDPEGVGYSNWSTDLEHAGLCAGWEPAASAGGSAGRALHCRGGAGAGLPEAAGLKRRALRGGSLWSAGQPDVSHRGSGAVACLTECWISWAGLDQQVKLRGFRIEPGEIEAVLLSHPAVAQAAVIAREDRPGDKRLVGYVVPANGQCADPALLRSQLGQSLPDYMVPAAIVLLDALPLTANGKLDRKALPAPQLRVTPTWQAPGTPQEEVLCALFAETLGLPRVGIEDNFFELGGDSISSIELVSRARQAGLLLTPRDIFQHQSVEALAAVAGAMDKTNAAVSDIGIGPLPLTPIMRWLLERGGSIGGFSQSMLLQVPSRLTEDQLIGAVQALLDHHDALRLRLVGAGQSIGTWGLEVAPPGAIRAAACVRRIDVSGLDELAARACRVEQAQAAQSRLEPEAGVMVQGVWFDAGVEQAGRVLLTIHHLAVDGVSWRILVPDLAAAWGAIAAGQAPRWSRAATSFRALGPTAHGRCPGAGPARRAVILEGDIEWARSADYSSTPGC